MPATHLTTLNPFRISSGQQFLNMTLIKIFTHAQVSSTILIFFSTNSQLFRLCGPVHHPYWPHTKTSLPIHHHLPCLLLILAPSLTTSVVVKSIGAFVALYAPILHTSISLPRHHRHFLLSASLRLPSFRSPCRPLPPPKSDFCLSSSKLQFQATLPNQAAFPIVASSESRFEVFLNGSSQDQHAKPAGWGVHFFGPVGSLPSLVKGSNYTAELQAPLRGHILSSTFPLSPPMSTFILIPKMLLTSFLAHHCLLPICNLLPSFLVATPIIHQPLQLPFIQSFLLSTRSFISRNLCTTRPRYIYQPFVSTFNSVAQTTFPINTHAVRKPYHSPDTLQFATQ